MHNRNFTYGGLEGVPTNRKVNNSSLLPMVLMNTVWLYYRKIPSLFTFMGLTGKARYIIEYFLSQIYWVILCSFLNTRSLKKILLVYHWLENFQCVICLVIKVEDWGWGLQSVVFCNCQLKKVLLLKMAIKEQFLINQVTFCSMGGPVSTTPPKIKGAGQKIARWTVPASKQISTCTVQLLQ